MAWDGSSAYHVFDILWLDGSPTTALPIEKRLALLQALPFTPPLRHVEPLTDAEPWERARREGWEGVIAKRRGSPYEHKRSKHWLKLKVECSQELVVGGFTDPQGARVGLGALLVGYYDPSTSSGSPRAKSRGDGDNIYARTAQGDLFSILDNAAQPLMMMGEDLKMRQLIARERPARRRTKTPRPGRATV
jgi:ATP dependent DNA ligase domain